MEIDKKVENLLNGIYNLFELKFPSKNFNIKPIINELGYHMTYLGVCYSINFIDVEKSHQATPFKAWTFRAQENCRKKEQFSVQKISEPNRNFHASKNPNKPTPLGVGKIQEFFDEKSMRFELRAEYSKSIPNLEERLNKIIISNKQLDETKYFSNHQININNDSINVSCRINEVPASERETNFLCDKLWELIIRNVFLGIHN